MRYNIGNSKKHHYIPRFLLKYFVFNDDQIYVYDKLKKRTFLQNIYEVACENEYNTIYGNNFEQIYNDFDNIFSIILNKIIDNESLSCLNQEEYDYLYLIFIVQFIRSPIIRSTFSSTKQFITNILNKFVDKKINYIRNENDEKMFSIQGLDKIDDYYNKLTSRTMILLRNHEDDFLLSDNCITMQSITPYEQPFLYSNLTEIDFPISPKLTLGLLPERISKDFRKGLNNHYSDEFVNAVNDKTCLDISHSYKLNLNVNQCIQSKRFIYSKYSIKDYFIKETGFFPDFEPRENNFNNRQGRNPYIRKEPHVLIVDNDCYYTFTVLFYKHRGFGCQIRLSKKIDITKFFNKKIQEFRIYENQFPVSEMKGVEIKLSNKNADTIDYVVGICGFPF